MKGGGSGGEGGRIRILPDHVANQIAAGEVVERPASVVKELVENALDAGASRIEITLQNGGKTLIRVADDGEGMERGDALLALDRHATSKIREAEDLRSVASFGFRGEALPSIAAVSRFDLETAPAGGGPGTHVRVRAGRILAADEIARRPGTTVTVRSLFRDVPARAKFLRSSAAETRAASEAVVLLALANPGVGFRLVSNDRELMALPPADSVAERVAAIWGDELADELLELDAGSEAVRVAGLIQRPDAARPAGGRRYLFVNGRPFQDPALVREVDEAYRTTVAPGLRPTAFLYLAVPPGRVDVNVHPAKAEVRFRERDAVVEVLRGAVRERLGGTDSAAPVGSGGTTAGRGIQQGGEGVHPTRAPAGRSGTGERESEGSAEEGADPGAGQLAFFVSRAAGDGPDAAPAAERSGPGASPGAGAGAGAMPELWQLHDRYILVPTREGLLIVDQHSAHERILFEATMERFAGEGGVSQRLLFPLTLRLSPAEFGAVEELGGLLRKAGFEVEVFGDRTVILHATPDPHPAFDAERCFREMIHELAYGSELVNSARNQHERIAKSLACKAAIKAGQPLSPAERQELVDRLFATELPGHDVHGRPTILRLTLEELERRFGRT